MFALALIALGAVAAQLHQAVDAGEPIANFFSLFTIQSNIFAGLVLIFAPSHSMLRGAATLYLWITAVTFIVALRDQNLIPWVDLMLHYVMPAMMLITWLLDPPFLRISFWIHAPVASAVS